MTRMERYAEFGKNLSIKFGDILAVDFLMTELYHNQTWGTETDKKIFQNNIEEFFNSYFELREIEQLESKSNLVDQNNIFYGLKYQDVLVDIHKSLDLVDADTHDPDDVGYFHFIDKTARVRNIDNPFDFEVLYKNYFFLVTTINHEFRCGYHTSQIHDYPATTSDFAGLLSLWCTCKPNKLCSLERDGLKQIYEETANENRLQRNFDKFLENYSSGKKYAPILVFDGQRFHYDYTTLLFMLFYMFFKNKIKEGTQTSTGHNTWMKQKQKAAHSFEVEIRKKFRNEGFTVFPKQDEEKFEHSVDGQCREFDCIAIDYDKKIIVSIDAKYEDIAPSSKTGYTILNQIVLDKKSGLLKHAKDHHSRLQFLIKKFDKLPLKLTGNLWNYEIHSLVVTKHKPMISKHLTSQLVSFAELKDIDFRMTNS